MPTKLKPHQWFPAKGLNTALPAHEVPMDMASAGYDFVVENLSKLKKRPGFDEVNATAVSASPAITSLASLYLSNGSDYELIGTDNGGVWQDVAGVVTTSVFVFATFSVNQPVDFTQFLDTGIFMDGSASARSWDGAASGTITAAPVGKYGETHLNKFWVTGIAGALSRTDCSATGDFNTWAGAGTDQYNIAQNDGDEMKGIKSYAGNELVLFKERSMHKIIGDSTTNFLVISVDKSVGCVCNRSIQNFKASSMGGILIWAARDGIYVYDGTVPKKISEYIQPFWDNVNEGRWEWMDSCIDDNGRYYLTVSTGSNTTHDRKIVVDLNHPWTDASGLHFPIFIYRTAGESLNSEVTSTGRKTVFGDDAGFKMYFSDLLYSDNGASIESYVESPLMTFGTGIGMEECLRRMYTALESTAGDVSIYTEIKDGGDWTLQEVISTGGTAHALGVDFEIGVSAIGITEITQTARTNVKARSRRIKVKYLQDSATQYYTLLRPVELFTKVGGSRN